jgi:hypothetical protein
VTNTDDASVIADYLNAGGQVRRGEETVPATAQEIIAYLASRGVKARYCPGDAKLYLCRGKRVSASDLVGIANRLRHADSEPLFAIRLEPLDLNAGPTSM